MNEMVLTASVSLLFYSFVYLVKILAIVTALEGCGGWYNMKGSRGLFSNREKRLFIVKVIIYLLSG